MNRHASQLWQIGGLSLAGVLVEIITAPLAILADACSYVIAALSLALIHTTEPAPVIRERRASLVREIGEGLR